MNSAQNCPSCWSDDLTVPRVAGTLGWAIECNNCDAQYTVTDRELEAAGKLPKKASE